jgi:TPP-dependent pyruvate/acetoin dehydrogenase alpha subunit
VTPAVTITCSKADLTPEFRDQYVATYRQMLSSRVLEEKLGSLYRAGGRIVGGVYLGKGQEAFSAAVGIQLRRGQDVYAPLIRDQAGRMAFGEPITDALRTYMGAATGPMRGRDGNIHRGRPQEGEMAMISHLGAMVSVVAGALFAKRLRGEMADAVGATSIGDGATSTGAFHEAINLAAVEKLPLIISVANNQFAYSTSNDRQFACEDLIHRARGYGVQGWKVDATDLAACLKVARAAVASARSGGGPQLIVGTLLRLVGHGEHDDSSYIPDEVKFSKVGQDCLLVAEKFMIAEGWATKAEITSWLKEARLTVDQAVSQVSKEPIPDPYRESWQALSSSELVESWQL